MKKIIFLVLVLILILQFSTLGQINISSILNSVSNDTLRANILQMQNFGVKAVTNSTTRTNLDNARNWIKARLQLDNIQIIEHSIVYGGNTYYNIVGTIAPSVQSDSVVLLTAHYDSDTGSGADDNGTGIAALLEMARLIKRLNVPLRDTVKFVFHPLEEEAVWGSGYPDTLLARGTKVKVVINVDMIGYYGGGGSKTTWLIQDTVSSRYPTYNNAMSKKIADSIAVWTMRYSGFTKNVSKIDELYFDAQGYQEKGFVVTGFFEGTADYNSPYNPYWHTSNDLIQYVDTNLVRLTTRAAFASLIKIANTPNIISLDPSSAAVGSNNTLVRVLGDNFKSDDVIRVNGNSLTTTYISKNELRATIPSSYFQNSGQLTITVSNGSDIFTDPKIFNVYEVGGCQSRVGNVIDNFNCYSVGDTLHNKGKWISNASATNRFLISGNGTDNYVTTQGTWRIHQVRYDTSVTSAFNFGVRMRDVTYCGYIQFIITTQINQLWSNGFGFFYNRYTGLDTMRIMYYPGSQVQLASFAREMQNGDTIAVKYSNDTLYFGVFNGENSQVITAVEDTFKNLSKYVQIYGYNTSGSFSFDDFMTPDWTRNYQDVTPPTVVSYQIYPSQWDTSTSGYIEARITDNQGIDSIYIRWNNADSLKIKCGNTTDTTIRRNIAKKPAGTYTYNVRAVDKSNNVTTTNNKSVNVTDFVPDISPPVVVDYYISPSLWDTSTTGYIYTRVTDNQGIDSIYIRWNNADSLKIKCGNTSDTVVIRNLTKKSIGTYSYSVRVVDKSANTTTSELKYFNVVANKSSFYGMIAWLPWYHLNGSITSNSYGTTYSKIAVSQIPYRKITHLVWMMSSPSDPFSTDYPYFVGEAKEDNSNYFDYQVKTANYYTGQTTNFLQLMRDSCDKAGVRLLLGLSPMGNGASGSQSLVFDTNIQDSAKTQLMVDRIYNYLVARGFDGVALNFEFPTLGDGTQYLRFFRLLHKKLKSHNPPFFIGDCVNKSGTVWQYPRPTGSKDPYVDVNMPMWYGMGGNTFASNVNASYHSPIYGKSCYTSNNYIDAMKNGWINNPPTYNSDVNKFAGCFIGEGLRIATSSACNLGTFSTSYYAAYGFISKGVQNITYDNEAKAAYVMDGTSAYITIDYYPIIQDKINYYANLGLKWLWYWDLGRGIAQPDANHTVNFLIDSIYNYLNGYNVVPFPAKLIYPSRDTALYASQVNFKWNRARYADSYNIKVYRNNNLIINTTTSDTTYTPDANIIINDGANYSWEVYSISAGGATDKSTTFNFVTVNLNQLPAPNLISPSNGATGLHPDSITLKWNNVNGATGYTINVSTNNQFTTILVGANTVDTIFTIASGVLGQGLTYYWRVMANGSNPSSWSEAWNYSTRIIYPLTQKIDLYLPIADTTFTSNVVIYRWQKVQNRNYNLIVKTDTLGGNYFAINNLADTVYTAINMHINGTYYYRVETVADTIKSGWRRYIVNIPPPQYQDTTVTMMTIVYNKNLKKLQYDVPQIMIREALPEEMPTPPTGYSYLFIHKNTKLLMLIDNQRNIKLYNNQ